MSLCDEIRVQPFWDFSDGVVIRPRINGGRDHHCDICPKLPHERCNDPCHNVRQAIKDGVTVT